MRIKQTRGLQQRSFQRKTGTAAKSSNDRADWQRKYDHYLARARSSNDAGDRVETENNYQHADHYFRLLLGTAA